MIVEYYNVSANACEINNNDACNNNANISDGNCDVFLAPNTIR